MSTPETPGLAIRDGPLQKWWGDGVGGGGVGQAQNTYKKNRKLLYSYEFWPKKKYAQGEKKQKQKKISTSYVQKKFLQL